LSNGHVPFRRGEAHIPEYYKLRSQKAGKVATIADAYEAVAELEQVPALEGAALSILTAGRLGAPRAEGYRQAMLLIEAYLKGAPTARLAKPETVAAAVRLDTPKTIRDVFDIAWEFDLPFYQAFALKYVARAGKKPGEAAEKDLAKAMESLQRLLLALGDLRELKTDEEPCGSLDGECFGGSIPIGFGV
jgi:hypothetical protein